MKNEEKTVNNLWDLITEHTESSEYREHEMQRVPIGHHSLEGAKELDFTNLDKLTKQLKEVAEGAQYFANELEKTGEFLDVGLEAYPWDNLTVLVYFSKNKSIYVSINFEEIKFDNNKVSFYPRLYAWKELKEEIELLIEGEDLRINNDKKSTIRLNSQDIKKAFESAYELAIEKINNKYKLGIDLPKIS